MALHELKLCSREVAVLAVHHGWKERKNTVKREIRQAAKSTIVVVSPITRWQEQAVVQRVKTFQSHSKALRLTAKQSVSSGKTTKPFDNVRQKRDGLGIKLDIRAFAFTTHTKCFGVFRHFFSFLFFFFNQFKKTYVRVWVQVESFFLFFTCKCTGKN